MSISRRIFGISLALTPLGSVACSIDGPEAFELALDQSSYVFLARVGPTTREQASSAEFGSALSSQAEILEAFKGSIAPGDRIAMHLAQPHNESAPWPAFAWEGDHVVILTNSLPVTEAAFAPSCLLTSMRVGNDDQPGSQHPLIQELRVWSSRRNES